MPNSASSFKPDQRFFGLFVGRSGDGKSAAEDSFPKKLLEIDFDLRFGGISAALKQGWLHGEAEIEYQQFSPIGGWLPVEKLCTQLDAYRLAGNFPYKTLGVGSLTSLARLLLNFSHGFQKGKFIGPENKKSDSNEGQIRMSGPGDFNLEATGVHQFFDHLRTYPCNVIVTAHIVDKWGRIKTDENPFPPSEIIGEKLSIRDNLGENVQSYFDNVFRFSRELIGVNMKYFVEFSTDLAKNSYGITPGKHDITNKEFYPFLQELIEKYNGKVMV